MTKLPFGQLESEYPVFIIERRHLVITALFVIAFLVGMYGPWHHSRTTYSSKQYKAAYKTSQSGTYSAKASTRNP